MSWERQKGLLREGQCKLEEVDEKGALERAPGVALNQA